MDPADETLINAVLQECQLDQKKSVLYVMNHFLNNLNIVTSANLYLTTVSNPAHLQPEQSSALLATEGSDLKQQLENSVSFTLQKELEKLQEQTELDTNRIQILERDVIDLTTARNQLRQKLESKEGVGVQQESLEVSFSTVDKL